MNARVRRAGDDEGGLETSDLEESGTRPIVRLPRVRLEHQRLHPSEMRTRARDYADAMQRRRTVRDFSDEPFSLEIVDDAIRAAASAPSGANQQPWSFTVITDPDTKRRVRTAAELEEQRNWGGRMSPEWIRAVAPLGVDWNKPHLTDAPVLIVVFAQPWREDGDGKRIKHYYVDESVGMAVGILLSALHLSGLVTLTHTPSPMRFLRELLGRPANERAYVVIAVGYPKAEAEVPVVGRKSLDEVRFRR